MTCMPITHGLLQPFLLCQGVDVPSSKILECSSVEMAFQPITQICFPTSAVDLNIQSWSRPLLLLRLSSIALLHKDSFLRMQACTVMHVWASTWSSPWDMEVSLRLDVPV